MFRDNPLYRGINQKFLIPESKILTTGRRVNYDGSNDAGRSIEDKVAQNNRFSNLQEFQTDRTRQLACRVL